MKNEDSRVYRVSSFFLSARLFDDQLLILVYSLNYKESRSVKIFTLSDMVPEK